MKLIWLLLPLAFALGWLVSTLYSPCFCRSPSEVPSLPPITADLPIKGTLRLQGPPCPVEIPGFSMGYYSSGRYLSEAAYYAPKTSVDLEEAVESLLSQLSQCGYSPAGEVIYPKGVVVKFKKGSLISHAEMGIYGGFHVIYLALFNVDLYQRDVNRIDEIVKYAFAEVNPVNTGTSPVLRPEYGEGVSVTYAISRELKPEDVEEAKMRMRERGMEVEEEYSGEYGILLSFRGEGLQGSVDYVWGENELTVEGYPQGG